MQNKLIYFPRAFGDGNRYGYPEIIHVGRRGNGYINGSALLEEVEAGRFRTYDVARCMPYSDQTWHLCRRHIEKRNELEAEYKKLCAMAKRTTTGV